MSTLVKKIVPLKNSTGYQGSHRGSALLVSFGVSLLLLSGCAVGPDFVRPEAPKVTRYTHEGDPKRSLRLTVFRNVLMRGSARQLIGGRLSIQHSWMLRSVSVWLIIPAYRRPRPVSGKVRKTCVQAPAFFTLSSVQRLAKPEKKVPRQPSAAQHRRASSI